MSYNREESNLVGKIDAQKAAIDRRKTFIRERDSSSEETLSDGSIRGLSIEYKTITNADGSTYQAKSSVRYWCSAEAVLHSKFKG